MSRGPHKSIEGLRNGEPDRVLDDPRRNFVVFNQAGENGQTSSVSRGPAGGPQGVRFEIENRPGARLPARGLRLRAPQFIENAVIGVDGDRMPVPGTGAAAFNR